MKKTSMASKCAAILCAAAMCAPVAAFAAPAAVASIDNSIVASAATTFDFPKEGYYVPVGQKVSLTVGGVSDDDTVEWYYSNEKKNTGFSWTKMDATGDTLSFKMTEAMNGVHVKAVVIDNETGESYSTEIPTTLSCTAVNIALSTPIVTNDGEMYTIKVPVIVKGAPSNAIDFYQADFRLDGSVFTDPDFKLSSNIGEFDASTMSYKAEENKFSWFGSNVDATAYMGTDNVLGYYEFQAPASADILGSQFLLENVQLGTSCINSYMYYGVKSVKGTTLASSVYPVAKVRSKGDAIKLSWSSVAHAKSYVIAYSTTGKSWKVAKKVSADTTNFTYSGLRKGTYYLVVGAYVNGKVDTSNLAERAVKVTIK